ncbi:hypothetical protein AVEN_164121-1 [Araneus ventricosus]|uniref:Uncharacterized protein n=1 Tax=Araneus ventricosus TaxID=182803 RepID=A0A4Y2SPJ2_ARAVE|nr:hypothetical protein AVEN_164121-1 [Araneus ventricosus]
MAWQSKWSDGYRGQTVQNGGRISDRYPNGVDGYRTEAKMEHLISEGIQMDDDWDRQCQMVTVRDGTSDHEWPKER